MTMAAQEQNGLAEIMAAAKGLTHAIEAPETARFAKRNRAKVTP